MAWTVLQGRGKNTLRKTLRRIAVSAACAAGLLVAGVAQAQPNGIASPRVANTSILIDAPPGGTPGAMKIDRVFNNITFEAPNLLIESPDTSNRLFAVEQRGRIRTIPNIADPSAGSKVTYLDIASQVRSPLQGGGGSEEGLLGMAFDPDFATSGKFYVYYSPLSNPRRTRISRFTASPANASTVSTSTEEVILDIAQPTSRSNHKAGMLNFGPDNMLYINVGDGGGAGDPDGNGQSLTTLLGKILRIDVRSTPDAGLAYRIPDDNPFYNNVAPVGLRKEIYAYGMRNPWRGSFDKLTGAFLVADVGQGTYEEVDVILSGKNYGWKITEGNHCYSPSSGCNFAGITLPIAEYDHTQGISITGGYVFFSNRLPELYGKFIYGDYGSGKVWALQYNPSTQTTVAPVELVDWTTNNALAAFGQDKNGEVYLLNVSAGTVHILNRNTAPPVTGNQIPTRLSDIPALLAAGKGQDQTALGIIPFAPTAKLWSDAAVKERFMAIPNLGQATYHPAIGWDFPENTILIKNFSLDMDETNPVSPLKRLETRLLFHQNGSWTGYSYEWNDAETDALLLTAGKKKPVTIATASGPLQYEWLYPSAAQCLQCHTNAANNVLGLHTPQMNADYHYPLSGVTDNQLRALDHIGLFTSVLPDSPSNLPRMPDPFDTNASLESRARAYLNANCAHCHQPAGGGPVDIDMRWETATASMGLVNVVPDNDFGLDDPRRIKPGDPDNSALVARISTIEPALRMPPVGRARVDTQGVQLIRDWITSMGASRVNDWTLYE